MNELTVYDNQALQCRNEINYFKYTNINTKVKLLLLLMYYYD
jgi:hypothetical protein